MKSVIRRSVWETNSSSQHSICVTKRNEYQKIKKYDRNSDPSPDVEEIYLRDGKWRLRHLSEGYGRWPLMILTTFEDKLKYAMCEYLGDLYPDDPRYDYIYSCFKSIVKEQIPEFENFRIDKKEIDIYLDEHGNEIPHEDLIYDGWENGEPIYCYKDENGKEHKAILDMENVYEIPNIGMIDHQSMGLLKNFIKDREISLKEFLTNKKYNIVVTGDEYEDWDRLKASGIIDLDNIEEEYFGRDDQKRWEEYRKEHDLAEDFEDEASDS